MKPMKPLTSGNSLKSNQLIFLAGFLISLAIGLLSQYPFQALTHLNYALLDEYAGYEASHKTAFHTTLIDVDDLSLSAMGQWPWPRYRFASLLKEIGTQSPAIIGLDIVFSEPDRTSLKNIKKAFEKDFGIGIDFNEKLSGLEDNDAYFGNVIGQDNVVGGQIFYFDYVNRAPPVIKSEFNFTGALDLLELNEAKGLLTNIPELNQEFSAIGFLNSQTDSDGRLRRLPLLIRYAGKVYPSLALATYMRSTHQLTASIEKDRTGLNVVVGKVKIPIDKQANVLLTFYTPQTHYPTISALNIVKQDYRPDDLHSKIVLIGSSATGLNDLHNTRLNNQFPGLQIQATLIENILDNQFIKLPYWSGTAQFILVLIAGCLLAAAFVSVDSAVKSLIIVLMILGGLFGFSALLFHWQKVFISPASALINTVLLYMVLTTASYLIERKKANAWYKKLANARQVTMESMAAVAETRDPETGAHIKRTQYYVRAIAESLKHQGFYQEMLSNEYINLLFISAPLHDIGKVGVPDNILLKPGKLSEAEFEIMKKHAQFGREIILSSSKKIDGDNFLEIAGEIAYTHHERWDGTGYPQALSGEKIPLSGRIMAVADVYDALISKRCYKEAYSHATAMNYMREYRATIFDPTVLDAFIAIEETIIGIAAEYQDAKESAHGSVNNAYA